MSLWSALKSIWGRVQRVLTLDPRKEILALLSQEYVDKMKDAFQYRRHAEQMRYKHFREKLLRIAEDEEKHAQWLKERILALGGEIPEISSEIEDGWNTWEDLRLRSYGKEAPLMGPDRPAADGRAIRCRDRDNLASHPRRRRQSSGAAHGHADAERSPVRYPA